MNIKKLAILGAVICLIATTVFSQRPGRRSSGRGRRNAEQTQKDPNSLEQENKESKSEETQEQKIDRLEEEVEKLLSRVRILELDIEVLFYELINFRATVYRENIIDDIRRSRDIRTQEERWRDMGYYPILPEEWRDAEYYPERPIE